jgi:hypothetical protein
MESRVFFVECLDAQDNNVRKMELKLSEEKGKGREEGSEGVNQVQAGGVCMCVRECVV